MTYWNLAKKKEESFSILELKLWNEVNIHWKNVSHDYQLELINSKKLGFEGTSNKSRDYEIQGSKTDKIYNAIGAMSAIIVANAAGMIPEMQVN